MIFVGSYQRLLYGISLVGHPEGKERPDLKEKFIVNAHGGPIKCIASDGEKYIATGSTDECIK